jgi:gamma-glutamyltranspeptidase/glutathione hydrolase
VRGETGIEFDSRLPAKVQQGLLARPGSAAVEHTVWPQQFACPNLILRGADGINLGITDAMSPWSAAVAEPGCEVAA